MRLPRRGLPRDGDPERYAMTLANGVLTHSVGQRDREAGAIKVGRLLELLEEPDFAFPIVTPRAPLATPEHPTAEEEQ